LRDIYAYCRAFYTVIVKKDNMEKTSCFYRYSGDCTWYQPQACKFLKLEHHIHLPYEKKSLIDRTFSMLIIESKALIMTIFHVEEKKCKLQQYIIINWFNFFG
jgi:hypothetical protein